MHVFITERKKFFKLMFNVWLSLMKNVSENATARF